jgi:gluconokinase
LLQQRLRARHGHFMTERMLNSQLETLEEPEQSEHGLVVDVDQSPAQIVAEIRTDLAAMETRTQH